ncbi:MAG: TolC family protein [Elusimicrobiaceae bacterium]|nr:TolC family protein [Elusimicrobiaceae bacterium]
MPFLKTALLAAAGLLPAAPLYAQTAAPQPPMYPVAGYTAAVVSGPPQGLDNLVTSQVIEKFDLPQKHVVKDGDELTLDQCLSIALDQDPDLLASRFSAQAAQAALKGSKSAYYPAINAQVYAQKYGAPYTNPQDPYVTTQQQKYTLGGGGISLKQLLLDFGSRSGSIGASSAGYKASLYDLENLATQIARDIKQYYYDVIRAKRALDVNIETVSQYEQHLAVAQAQFGQGSKPKYDVTKAETDLSGAQLGLIRARNEYELARIRLNSAMFLTKPGRYSVRDTLDYTDYSIALDDILNKAYENRPDLKALAQQYAAAEFEVRQARSDYYPSFYASGAYNAAGSETPASQNWNAGLSLELNIFQGMKTRAAVERGNARQNALKAQLYSKGRDIYMEAQKSLLALSEAEERISNAAAQVKEASENLEIATVRYQTGISTPIELTDATASYSDAKLQFITALYDYKIAQADIEKTMGSR